MADKERKPGKPRGKAAEGDFMTFQDSAKKFKPGPVALPTFSGDRPNMSGEPRTTATGSLAKEVINDPARGRMTDGSPGQFKKMPEEEAERSDES